MKWLVERMKTLQQRLNKKYDKSIFDNKEIKKQLKVMQSLLQEYEIELPAKQDSDYFIIESVYQSLLVKRKFEDVFLDTYVSMFDYWYDLTYLQRKYQMNIEINQLKESLECFSFDEKTIFMPAFTVWLNDLYQNEIVLLDLKQYHTFIRDCKKEVKLHQYGYHMYDTKFSSAKICEIYTVNDYVLYHEKTNRFYVYQNDQCISVCSLDPKHNELSDDVKKEFADALYKHDEARMINLIIEYSLVGNRMKKKIQKYKSKVDKKKAKEDKK